jgi:flagellar motor protein MotB
VLSSFLDNAPTYLVFFQLAGGDPAILMGPLAGTLAAISLGAVFMGANTYIGNAPNFMVYAIARRAGVRMPGFFPYMLWSGAILLPLFAAVAYLFIPNPPLEPKAAPAEQVARAADATAPPPVSAISPSADAELARQAFEDLRRQLRILQDDAARAEARNRELEGKIADLEARDKAAPSRAAAGLARVRADFFDRLAQTLGDRPGVGVEGDHFVLPAQALFGQGPARLDAGGRARLDVVAKTILALEDAMPKDVAWIVRVDGHADATPVASKNFESNWALAFERANAVVQYLVKQGAPPQRLVAASFGEFQPLRRPQDSAGADNRRIELTIVDR